jgi:hypothetical protein
VAADPELIALFGGLHLIGLVLVGFLLVMVFRSDTVRPWRPPDEGDGGDGGGNDRVPPRRSDRPGGGGLPLPDAVPARVRLRDHRRLGELLPRPPRRPVREPARVPTRVPRR